MYYFGLMLSVAAIYMMAGAGAAFSLKTGRINLAGEGLIYIGGFLSAVLLDFFARSGFPAFFAVLFAFLIAAACGALILIFCEALYKFRHADFLLTTFITSSAIIPLIDGLISGPFRTKTGNLLATPYLVQQYRFTSILKPSPLNFTIFISIALCVALEIFFRKTRFGKHTQIYGISPQFAMYSGFACNKITFTAAGVCGALHALAGACAICGIYFTCHISFYSGMGWNALSVAMIAKTSPALVIPASIAMSALMTYSGRYALYSNLDFDVNMLIQAVVLFMVAVLYSPHKRRSTNA